MLNSSTLTLGFHHKQSIQLQVRLQVGHLSEKNSSVNIGYHFAMHKRLYCFRHVE